LGLQQQIVEILVATAPSKKGFDVAVDGLHHSEGYFGAAVVENTVQMIQQHVGEVLKRYQPLPEQRETEKAAARPPHSKEKSCVISLRKRSRR